MKPRLFVLVALLVGLVIVSTVVVLAQGPQPANPPQFSNGYNPSAGTNPLQGWNVGKSLPSSISPQRSAGAPKNPKALTLGQPGTSFRYVQTFGVTGQAYTTDNQHLNAPSGLFIDGSDNVFVGEDAGYRVLKYDSSGSNVLALGTPGSSYTDNYVFSLPQDVALDAGGNIWVADGGNRVVEYNSSGVFQQTLPATNSWESGTDNTHFNWVTGIAFDNVAGRMFVSDSNNRRIQVYIFSGTTPVYSATIGVTGVSGNDNSHFNNPRRLSVDGSGRLYVVDTNNGRIQRCSLSGTWSCTTFTSGLNYPEGIGLDSSGNVYIANTQNSSIVKCNSSGSCNLSFITGFPGWTRDVATDTSGNVYVSDLDHKVIRKYDSSGISLGIFVGTIDVPYFVDTTRINAPAGIAIASDSSVYFTENNGQRLIKLSASGVQQWIVGQAGVNGGWNAGDNAHLNWPEGSIALDGSGRVYVADHWNRRIQVYNSDGSFYTSFGSYGTGNNQFGCTNGVAISPANGDILVVDQWNKRVQVYTSAWVYKATLGTTGASGSDGTHFNNPRGVAVDASGNVYVADSDNHRVQKCTLSGSSGTCTVYLGETNVQGNDFAHFSHPIGVSVDSGGRLFVADEWNNRVQVFDASGAYLTTLGGSWGTNTGQLRSPQNVASDGVGNVYVTDRTNNRIQKYVLGVPGWRQVNINGFGDLRNSLILALAPFGGQLYAGTYNGNGAQLWRQSAGGAWTSVMTNGFGDSNNGGIDHLIEFNGNLYAGTANWISTNATLGGQVWRSSNGTNWNQVTLAGFDPTNGEVFRFSTFDNKIYASTWSYTNTHGAEIWRSDTGNSGDWTRVMSNGFNNDANASVVLAMTSFNGYLYATKANWNGMAQVWRCTTCAGSDWNQINTNGFDGSTTYTNTVAMSLASFNGYLYAGTRNRTSGAQLWHCSTCDSGSSWSQVVGPSAAVGSGFGNAANGRIDALVVHDSMLYAITDNTTSGMEVWRTRDGIAWQREGYVGFGTSNNSAPYYSNSVAVFSNNLYIGTNNGANGGQVWQTLNALYLPLILR